MNSIFSMDDSYSVSSKIINLITLYTVVLSITGYVLLWYIGINTQISVTIVMAMLVVAALWGVYRLTGNYDLWANTYVYMLNIILLPLLFVYGGGLYGGMAVLFLGGYIVTFLALSGIKLLIAVIVTSAWYLFVFAFSFYYSDRIIYFTEYSAIWLDILFCFVATSFITTLVLLLYTNIFHRLRRSIEHSQQIIEETGAVKSRFLASMSNELRTPMNAILGMAELLEKEEKNGRVFFEISTIKDSAYALLDTINNVITYSQLDLNRIQLIPHQFYFGKMIKDIIYMVNIEMGNKGLQFVTEIDPTIPDVMYGDEVRISQVFHYILYNAVKSTDDGRIILKISHEKNESNKSARVFVQISDTSMGLTEDEKEAIFTSFEIYDSRKYSQLKKTGLELTICRDILKLMNGSLAIDSISDVGTNVSFDFQVFYVENTPIVKCDRVSDKRALVFVQRNSRNSFWHTLMGQFGIIPDVVFTYAAFEVMLREKNYDYIFVSDYTYQEIEGLVKQYDIEEKCYIITDHNHVYGDYGGCRILRRPISCLNLSEVVSGTWDAGNYIEENTKEQFVAPEASVLVVDDNMVNLKVAVNLLQKYEVNVSTASSGQEALDKCRREHFDIVFLDQTMPGMDGIETLSELRKSVDEYYGNAPVVCMTSAIGNDIREDLIRAGFVEYLVKPIKNRYLERVLKDYLKKELIHIKQEPDKPTAETVNDENIKPGLDEEIGLYRTGGSLDIYCAILNTYLKEGHIKIDEIFNQYADGDTANFVINVHAVKGSSASIGAMEVSELFRRLEMAGKEGRMEFVEENLDAYMEKYKEILETVKAYLIDHDCLEDNEVSVKELDEQEFDITTMIQVRDALEDFEIELCESIIKGWSGCNFGPEINNYVLSIEKAVDSFDYDRAQEFAEEFIEVFS